MRQGVLLLWRVICSQGPRDGGGLAVSAFSLRDAHGSVSRPANDGREPKDSSLRAAAWERLVRDDIATG